MIELLLCIIGCSLMLIVEHIGLWDRPWRLSPPASYSIGTLTLAFWFAIFCWLVSPEYIFFAVAFLLLAGGSGAFIILAYWLRGRMDILKQRSRNAGRAERSIAPFSPYTQDIIDRGGKRGPERPEPTYRNN